MSGSSDDRQSAQNDHLSAETLEEIKGQILHGASYRNPPKATQFKKGQSGDPRGRPKRNEMAGGGSRSANALALREAARMITIKEGDEYHQVPAIDAILRAQYVAATKGGSAYAQKHIIERYDRAEREHRRQIEEQIDYWEAYVEKWQKAIAEAAANKTPIPNPLPHPDDVVIDRDTGVRLVGPVNEEQAAEVRRTIKILKMLIMQDAVDERLFVPPAGKAEPSGDKVGGAMLYFHVIEQTVPKRLRMRDSEIVHWMSRYQSKSKRELLKMVYQGWKELGMSIPRGKTFPRLSEATKKLTFLSDFVRAGLNGLLDIDALAAGKFDEAAIEFFDERGMWPLG